MSPETSMTVIIAAEGYPGTPATGAEITGIGAAEAVAGARIFHAGTKTDGERLVASGGRVLAVTAVGANLAEARDRAYRAVDRIDFAGGFCRQDIGWRELQRQS